MSKPLIDGEGEVRELTSLDMTMFRPVHEVHPDFPKRVRVSQKDPVRVSVSLRLSPVVVDYFKATGKGWQSRIEAILLEHVEIHTSK
ncbi:MAG: hypothetical protein HW380_2040 [Magnetococcales bacterium]|nr:hypothetical protein [Magnetococcales bacterium]HIJ84575.1 BrnA antitoxin family protein [Magnetococcales bacterium]